MSAADLRRKVGLLRDALGEGERQQKSEQIWKRLVELPEFQAASQALFYVSFKSEVDTTLMRDLTRDLGIAVAVPRGSREDQRMTFHLLADEGELESGPYGILQPPANLETIVDFEVPTVVIVPGLVFDARCNRLGWGAGYYDRFLGGEGKGLPSVGLAFDCQLVDAVPVEPHDVPLDVLVTESRTIRRR